MMKSYLTIIMLFLLVSFSAEGQVKYNANDFSGVQPYTSPFYYGVNPGSYYNWDDRAKANIAAGNQALNIKGVGARSFHSPLPETFLETWGYDIRVAEFQHYASLGMKDHTIFLETPTAAHKDNTKYGGCAEESKLWKNLYTPIWDGGANGTPINETNYYAVYVYKTVSRYKNFAKFWEVINEPDMGSKAFAAKGTPGNWWENAPSPCDLSHIKAPIYHYIRMLRITYEVVKTLDPTAYVSPAGIGSGSFLDALLRYTDNPVDGSVTAEYPAKGGAYFDILSFHFYPMYSLKGWANGSYFFKRHSDAAIQTYIDHKNYLSDILSARGYNGVTYPKKFMICTENGLPRKAFGELIGSDEAQKNYAIKSLVESQKNDIRQYYWFILGDGRYENEAVWEYDVMGLYYNLNYNGPINGPGYVQKYTNAGLAFKTTSDLLSGFRYDANQTSLLNLPSNIGGAAFYNNSEYRYVLWAKTTTDKSETASATYSFPAAINLQNVKRREWNFTSTGTTTDISSQNITLSATPSFFLPGTVGTPPAPPVADAGTDQSITLPVSTVNLDGSKSTAPGGSITKYSWSLVSGPTGAVLLSPLAATTVINGLLQGSYVFRLTITNNAGLTATDDVMVTVAPAISTSQPPTANAGKDASIPVGQATVLHGETSTAAPGSTIASYRWTKYSGPASYEILAPTASATWIRNMVTGVYVYRLTITDNNGLTAYDDVVITVGGGGTTPNQAPTAKAGNDISITLPANSVTLSNAGSTDSDGSITAYKWTWISGPSQALPVSANASSTSVNNLIAGTYTYRLTVTDNGGLSASDDVLVTVSNATGTTNAPVANAGRDESVPVGQATVLHGENSTPPPGGTITSYKWTKYSGPASYEILAPNASATWIRNMVAGVYVYRLTVTGSNGLTAYDDVVITVGSGGTTPVNQAPVARAGNDISIVLPVNAATLSNAGSTDSDGMITAFKWSWVSGPSQPSLSVPNAASTQVSGLVAGTYVFRLTVTDNAGASSYDDVAVVVSGSANTTLPIANAGKDETIPVGQATVLHGEGSTAAAGIKSYLWTKYSGPSSYQILSPTSYATWIRYMTAGTYVYRLTITDNNGNVATDDVVITVYPLSGLSANSSQLEVTGSESGLRLSVYPNPVVSQLTYKWNSNYQGKADVSVINNSGSRLKSISINKAQQLQTGSIDVSSLRQGLYVLEIRTAEGKIIVSKFIKD